jgi:hypothetical protein
MNVGMIGYNEGNGHPYSFSAIINGYNRDAIDSCPYASINQYLSMRRKEDFGVGDFRVTHIWTPYPEVSRSIARYANVKTVTNHYKEMIGEVDAIIIARDDAESRVEIVGSLLDSGIKLFVDKPLCSTRDDLALFSRYLEEGQIMSCSALRYYPFIKSGLEGSFHEEEMLFCHCVAPLEWFKYGIHAVEGVYPLFRSRIKSVENIGELGNEIVRLQFASGKYIIVQVVQDIGGGIRSTIFFRGRDPIHVHFDDNFSCFKAQLIDFWHFVASGKIAIEPSETINIVEALIAGEESRSSRTKIEVRN